MTSDARAFIKELWREFVEAAKESPRMYFAPITGAAQAIYKEATRGTAVNTKKKNKQDQKQIKQTA